MTQREKQDALRLLTVLRERALREDPAITGFNIGTNIGRCGGAGLPDHLHNHVVARWNGDTNYMAVLGDVRVIPDGLDATYDQLAAVAVAMGLRDK